jgi:hypothetical protein
MVSSMPLATDGTGSGSTTGVRRQQRLTSMGSFVGCENYALKLLFQPPRHHLRAKMLDVCALSLTANCCSQARVAHEQQQAFSQLLGVVRSHQKSVHFVLDHLRDSAN